MLCCNWLTTGSCGCLVLVDVTVTSKSMEQSPWEASRPSASQQIRCILWNQQVHYCIHKSMPSVPILCQIYDSLSHSLKISFNIILTFMLSSSELPPLMYRHQNLCAPLHSPICVMFSPSLILDLVRTTYKAPSYVVFSTPLLLQPS